MAALGIHAQAGLTPAQHQAVVALKDDCEAAQPIDLKVELARADTSTAVNTVLAYEGAQLVGYCGIDAGAEAEVCGMVHPAHRRSGIASRMLGEAIDAAAAGGRASILVICEDAAPIARAWMQRRGATLSQSEHRMLLALNRDAPLPGPTVTLRRMDPGERPAVARILSSGFAEAAPAIEERLARSALSADDEPLVAFAGGQLVGTTRVIHLPQRSMIYGFVIDGAVRGRGHGGAMLRATLERLNARGVTQVGLEVDPDNIAAVRLYTRFGFRVVTTYRYMRLPT
ncbi:MAG TPA: GNAT family N-acetyltransferase [Candidatus Acidoferrales bacterium]|jgi:ribosomal protein S18 acetylase RimI-like enzyme|nr:GNAT family N-acetyltransferase [Candidatus Acidoferrales bacterium]